MAGFVDETGLHVKAGDGGAGCVSFRREAHVPFGGPDGGDGGGGGDVWLVADRNVASLIAFRDHPHRRGGDGTHGTSKRKHGAKAEDLVVRVPEGTVVRDQDGTLLADLVHAGDRWRAAEAGRGGKGNARFLSNTRRAPAFAEQGEVGEERWLRLELKLMADVALVGYPNVGKSTLIAAISAAKPRIADYPFTTLEPNLGVVRLDDGSSGAGALELVVADVPGLIEGASEGKGLGHRFLRHVERARALVVLVDLAWTQTGNPPPSEQARVLLRELAAYEPALLERPRLVVGSRGDLVPGVLEGVDDRDLDPDVEARPDWEPDDAELPLLRISAVTRRGLRPLLGAMAAIVARARAEEAPPSAFVVHRPVAEGFSVERTGEKGWEVLGRVALRAVALSDLGDPDALAHAQGRLSSLGVDKALARAGVRDGDTVRIGDFEFTYESDDQVILIDADGDEL